MTNILIVLGMNVILWEILIKLMFGKKLAGQPCPVTVSDRYILISTDNPIIR
jgi:hypothetical protein